WQRLQRNGAPLRRGTALERNRNGECRGIRLRETGKVDRSRRRQRQFRRRGKHAPRILERQRTGVRPAPVLRRGETGGRPGVVHFGAGCVFLAVRVLINASMPPCWTCALNSS